jgi:hypothetical protein
MLSALMLNPAAVSVIVLALSLSWSIPLAQAANPGDGASVILRMFTRKMSNFWVANLFLIGEWAVVRALLAGTVPDRLSVVLMFSSLSFIETEFAIELKSFHQAANSANASRSSKRSRALFYKVNIPVFVYFGGTAALVLALDPSIFMISYVLSVLFLFASIVLPDEGPSFNSRPIAWSIISILFPLWCHTPSASATGGLIHALRTGGLVEQLFVALAWLFVLSDIVVYLQEGGDGVGQGQGQGQGQPPCVVEAARGGKGDWGRLIGRLEQWRQQQAKAAAEAREQAEAERELKRLGQALSQAHAKERGAAGNRALYDRKRAAVRAAMRAAPNWM